ncbi:hypothetical protein ACEE21_08065 [Clostridium baratii]
MDALLRKINIETIEENIIDVKSFKSRYSEWLDNSGILCSKGVKRSSEGTFESNLWILLNELEQCYVYMDYSELLFNKKLTQDELDILKCWIIEGFMEDISIVRMNKRFKFVKDFIYHTENFSSSQINSKHGDAIATILDAKSNNSEICYTIMNYIEFLDNIGYSTDVHFKVYRRLSEVKKYTISEARKLPKHKDILAFDYYLKKFFKEIPDKNLIGLYYPLLLWWKITNVIPMRPSEFAYKLDRKCVFIEDNKYYININRVKVSDNSSNKRGNIPILKKLQITQDIYELINDYIQLTSFDNHTKTLLSYEAVRFFRENYYNSTKLGNNVLIPIVKAKSFKNDKFSDRFDRSLLRNLLESFYNTIIKGYYKDNSITEKLSLGDTRHLAFSSLVLQGFSPLEIAMIGGHSTLEAQESYTGHVEYYIDSEILDYISKRNLDESLSTDTIFDIIHKKPAVCPKFIVDCHPTEDSVGYCTVNLNSDLELCDNVEFCVYCKKWWCEPTSENYIKIKKYLEESSLTPLQQQIKTEETFLFKLISDAKTVNLEGLLELDDSYKEEVAYATAKLKSSVNKIIEVKKLLLDISNNINMEDM